MMMLGGEDGVACQARSIRELAGNACWLGTLNRGSWPNHSSAGMLYSMFCKASSSSSSSMWQLLLRTCSTLGSKALMGALIMAAMSSSSRSGTAALSFLAVSGLSCCCGGQWRGELSDRARAGMPGVR
jgi:hypothetical protein